MVPVVAGSNKGTQELKAQLAAAVGKSETQRDSLVPEIREAATALLTELGQGGEVFAPLEIERALIDKGGAAEQRFTMATGEPGSALLEQYRDSLTREGRSVAALEARTRYAWIDEVVTRVQTRSAQERGVTDIIDRATSHPLIGTVLFFLIMATVFQAVFSWAGPIMDLIDDATSYVGGLVEAALPPGALSSLIVDGVIAGVGGRDHLPARR